MGGTVGSCACAPLRAARDVGQAHGGGARGGARVSAGLLARVGSPPPPHTHTQIVKLRDVEKAAEEEARERECVVPHPPPHPSRAHTRPQVQEAARLDAAAAGRAPGEEKPTGGARA